MTDYLAQQIRDLEDPIYDQLRNPTMRTHIAGIPYRKPNLALLSVGDIVILEPEPTNEFDPNAIRVLHLNPLAVTVEATHLGYIPKGSTSDFRGVQSATIVEIVPDRKWSEVIIEANPEVPAVLTPDNI